MTSTSFWKERADSLPASVRERYAAYFEAAERWEKILDAGLDAWRRARLAYSLSSSARASSSAQDMVSQGTRAKKRGR